MKKRILLTILAIPIILLGLLYARIALKPEIDEKARINAPGNFIELNDGIVHYELRGPDTSEVIVLIHGANIPSFAWDKNYNELIGSGYRVLRYDLFGRGLSDRPRIEYTKEVYVNQLNELLSSLKITEKVHLVGTSMGGAVLVYFVSAWPEKVASITLIDPVGPYASFKDKSIMLKRSAKRLVDRIFGKSSMTGSLSRVRPLREKMKEQMKYKGVGWSVFSSVRNSSYDKLLHAYQFVGRKNYPSQLIWGDLDEVIPIENHMEIKKLIPDISFHVIKGAGHVPHYEKPEAVNQILLDFYDNQR